MSPLLQQILEEKAARRKRLAALPYPDKVRIVEQMRAAARQIQAAAKKSRTAKWPHRAGISKPQ
jgi:hypothetical protein